MIIMKIKGGLGNQLFCYFSSYIFTNNKNIDVLLDIYDYKFYRKDRPFFLDKFNTNFDIADKKLLQKYRYLNISKIDYALCIKFNINLYKKNVKKLLYFEENNKNKNLDHHQKNIKEFNYIDGFWQNFDFFQNIKNYIRNETEIKKHYIDFSIDLLNEIKNNNSVSIHVRRDDLLRKPFSDFYHLCSLNYYKQSVSIIEKKITNPKYYFFTDDINWVKNNFNFIKDKKIVSDFNYSDYSEFYLMKNCKHHIIANSTFSLWASWISENNSSIIITPKYWFKNINKANIHPRNWIEVKNV